MNSTVVKYLIFRCGNLYVEDASRNGPGYDLFHAPCVLGRLPDAYSSIDT